ncbi:MAG: hypothetical protein Q8N51_06640 [Gammaproteobacteria bacterium]|nr:hypothetical protein [Gammaproteobacteria bacterium]
MKGGITSGVIYPRLVAELASRYHFKNIGGTSAGAIAAGACAAAEFARSRGSTDSFTALEQLPKTLGEPTKPANRSKLFTLFQPADVLREHFCVFVGALNAKPAAAARRVALGLLKMYALLALSVMFAGSMLLWPLIAALRPGLSYIATAGIAIAFLSVTMLLLAGAATKPPKGVLPSALFLAGSVLAFAFLLNTLIGVDWSPRLVGTVLVIEVVAILVLALVLLVVAIRFLASLLRGLHGNGYGFCSGRTSSTSPEGVSGLTDWLTQYLDSLAGLPGGHRPLTFGDLWGTTDSDAPRQINLEVT